MLSDIPWALLPVRGRRDLNWAQRETSGTAMLPSSISLSPGPSTYSQLWQLYDFGNQDWLNWHPL